MHKMGALGLLGDLHRPGGSSQTLARVSASGVAQEIEKARTDASLGTTRNTLILLMLRHSLQQLTSSRRLPILGGNTRLLRCLNTWALLGRLVRGTLLQSRDGLLLLPDHVFRVFKVEELLVRTRC